MSKQPGPRKDPPIFDNEDMPTIFATEVAAISVRNGVFVFVFAEERAPPPKFGGPPTMERRVVARIAMTPDGVEKMMNSLGQMAAVIAKGPPTAGSA